MAIKALILGGLILVGIIAIWLLLWDFIDFLTTGINTGIWNGAVVIAGLPSIVVGFILLGIIAALGIKVVI